MVGYIITLTCPLFTISICKKPPHVHRAAFLPNCLSLVVVLTAVAAAVLIIVAAAVVLIVVLIVVLAVVLIVVLVVVLIVVSAVVHIIVVISCHSMVPPKRNFLLQE